VNRRGFIKICGVATVAAIVPIPVCNLKTCKPGLHFGKDGIFFLRDKDCNGIEWNSETLMIRGNIERS